MSQSSPFQHELPTESPNGASKPAAKDTWDELAELAAMTGYKSEPPPGKPVIAREGPLLDREDLDELDQSSESTTIPLWSNGLSKTAFVAVMVAIVLGGIYWFTQSLKTNWGSRVTVHKPSSTQELPKGDSSQDEIGRLKTLNALGSQAQLMSQASRRTPPTPQPVPAKPVPKPVNPTTPAYSPVVEANAAPLPSRSFSLSGDSMPVSKPTPQVAPEEAWQKAVSAGSAGNSDNNGAIEAGRSNPSANPPEKALSPSPTDDQARYEADVAALLKGEPAQTVTISPGTKTVATLTTPIVWAQDLKPEQQPQRFTVQLTQPLSMADGSVAFPAGSSLMAKVDAVSESGMMQLSVVSVVVPGAAGSHPIEIPAKTIVILAEEGSPLIAEIQNHQRDAVLGKDLTVALFGALGQVGTLLNRASQQTIMTSPYLSTTSTTNGEVNLLGGVLEGGFNKLADRMAERQQREIDEVLKRPNLWYVPAGKPVTVFVNTAVEISL